MTWFDWHPLTFLGYLGMHVYHTYSNRQSVGQQSILKYILSTDTSADSNSDYAFDVRDLENPLGLDIESPMNQMKLVAYAIEKGKIKFPEEQLQKEVDLTDPWSIAIRQPILDLLAQEELIMAANESVCELDPVVVS